jgi:SpoVK/Ycf46/Vps4 family AAA+-type ATPase
LEELELMIGMKNIKQMIVDLIFFRLQNIDDTNDDLWHLVIQGSPGSGKTEVAKILAKLYYALGIVKKDKITMVKRSDLIGKYLGHTAKMTQEVFDNSKGGVLFIDEAYSLGNPEGRDSFSKECIDTINQNLTENRETVVFIAGYKDQLNESFFSYNPGLNRRFKMRMSVDKYNAEELREIFLKKIKEANWYILNDNGEKEIPLSFFQKNHHMFKYNGGDMENLWHLSKIVHARRIFGKSNDLLKRITFEDIQNAFKMYCENDEVKNRNEDEETMKKYIMNTMYC